MKLRNIEGFMETEVTATVFYESERIDRRKQVEMEVESFSGENATHTEVERIKGKDPEDISRGLVIEQDGIHTVLRSYKNQPYKLGEVHKVAFPRKKQRLQAYLNCGGRFAAPRDAGEFEIREIAMRNANPDVYDVNSIVDPETDEIITGM